MSKKPAPFSRFSIDLSPVNREWRDIEAHVVRPGDTVSVHGVGTVTEVLNNVYEGTTSLNGVVLGYTDTVLAFVRR